MIPNLIEGLEDKGHNLPKRKEKRQRWKWGKTDEKVRAPVQEVTHPNDNVPEGRR